MSISSPTKIPGYFRGTGKLQANEIHIYTIHSTLCVIRKRVNRGARYGLKIYVIYTLRGQQKSIEWVKKAVEREIKLTNDIKKCLK